MNALQWNAVAEVLRTADFPVNRQDLINHARAQGADDGTVTLLWDLPIAIFRNLVDVRDAARAAARQHSPAAALIEIPAVELAT